MDIFMIPTVKDMNASYPAFFYFCTGTHPSLITFAYGNIASIRDVAKMIKWAAFGHDISF